MKPLYLIGFVGLLGIILCTGCAEDQPDEQALTVAAASDLYHVFSELGEAFTEETGIQVRFTFGATGQLTQQIRHGAPFDLFAAADETYIDQLLEAGFIETGSKEVYALGQIGLIFAEDQFPEMSVERLVSPHIERIVIANPEHAPYGRKAKEILQELGVWDHVQEKIVYADSVRQALQVVETGNAEVGLVAAAIAQHSPLSFELIETDEPLVQALGIVKASKRKEEARLFSDFILSPKGQEMLINYGFKSPRPQH
ncbi:molybdate ABC transporter substrate-binding protein [Caldalkalibacillus thermarum]|nr:molybdate ABC transporter substrate-binding protein [Caldalkalibacillus thermarum]